MTNYLIRRFFQMIIVVLLSSLAIYMLLNLAPGGPLSGLRLIQDRNSRLSESDIARITAYLGLDKPLVLRYTTWLVGDDWLGADWMYLGLTPYQVPQLDEEGQPITRRNRETGVEEPVIRETRFWANPGVAHLNPGYTLWAVGTETGTRIDLHPTSKKVLEFVEIEATSIQVRPQGERPEGAFVGKSLGGIGKVVWIEPSGGARVYELHVTQDTQWTFPPGTVRSRPTEGAWLNTGWLMGPEGLLGRYAIFHGDGKGVLRLDWGTSWGVARGQSVLEIIQSRLGNTLLLMTTATLVSLVIAIPIGIYSAVHQYSRVDYAVTTFSFFGSAMPVFWFGLMMILLFGHYFKIWGLPYMPTGGTALAREAQPGSVLDILNATPGGLLDRLVHIIMPAAVLSLLYMAGWSRFMRSSMLEVLRQDYVRTARAKGLTERVVIAKHALRNALIPIITIVVFQIPGVFGGAILTETIFSYPGIGRLYFEGLGRDDYPVVMVILFISAILVVFATLVGDVLYTLVDPRIRYS